MGSPDELTGQLAEQDWDAITQRLVTFAHRRLGCRSIEVAREIAQEALTRVWDPDYADWDPAKEPSLVRHLGSVVNGLVRNLNVSQRERVERAHDPDDFNSGLVAPGDARGRDGDQCDAKKIIGRFLERVESDELVTRLLFLMADGIDKPAEQATALGLPVKDVYNARRRLNGHIGPICLEFGLEVPGGF